MAYNCLGYIDEIDIITENFDDIEQLAVVLKAKAMKVGLTINADKTKLMEIERIPQLQRVKNLNGMNVEVVDSFKYVVMTSTSEGG